jgi:hypothetical protein
VVRSLIKHSANVRELVFDNFDINVKQCYTILGEGEGPTSRVFSLLKASASSFTQKNLLRRYTKSEIVGTLFHKVNNRWAVLLTQIIKAALKFADKHSRAFLNIVQHCFTSMRCRSFATHFANVRGWGWSKSWPDLPSPNLDRDYHLTLPQEMDFPK